MNRYPVMMMLLALATTMTAAGGCKQGESATKKRPPVPVQTMRLEPRSISRTLTYDADVQGEVEVKVFSQVPERVVALKFDVGDRVRRGQVLAVVRADTLAAGVKSAVAAIDSARANRDQLRDELARQRKLLARNIVPQSAVDALQAQLAAAEAQIRRLQAVARQARTARGNATITAPISGIVGERFVDAGDMAVPSMPICTIVRRDRVKLVLEIPEQDLALVKQGMTARVEVARFPDREFVGKVTRVLPTINRLTRTARVRVMVDNEDHELMPGMLARVRLDVERHDGVVVIPYSALIIEMGATGETRHRAFVLEQGKGVERTLSLGIVDGRNVEVTKGLKFGEQLVTRGQHLLEPGREADVVERLGPDGRRVVEGKGRPEKSTDK